MYKRQLLNNLTTGAVYTARVVAYTRAGRGPYSPAVTLSHSLMDPSSYSTAPPSQMWFVLLLAITAVVLVITFAATVYLRSRQTLTKESGHFTGES